MKEQLKNEFKYYLDNQDDLVKKYNGKFIVIKDCLVIGVFDTEYDAITETSKLNELGTFLVQKCEPGKNNYMRVYHSRVVSV